MNQLEVLRSKLHKVIETGDKEKILEISRELDELIVRCMVVQLNTIEKSA